MKKKVLAKARELVKSIMDRKAPISEETKKHMADNIKVSEIEKKDSIDFVKIVPIKGDNSEFFYSKFTEWGTSKIPAQHWAKNSLVENKRKINQTILEELKRGLEE
uniref:HK97-gp10 family putative phage morphogenesis protein n=1 Tax=Clostridium estertheticum TaxID=238834 RepID=UPI001CF5BB1F|nr:HK97-gp10 family putative phage morphogenesis protein [Clostridium estertheticum]MCB2361594.1 hypothetical protein [Clostridium estertheticum]